MARTILLLVPLPRLCTRRQLSTRPRPVGRPPPKSAEISRKDASRQSDGTSKPALPVLQALESVLAYARQDKPRKFVETVDLALQLGVDPKKPNQSVRGVQSLPYGTGKSIRVAVFAKGNDAEAAKAAGAAIVGTNDLVAQIQAGQLDFERCITTPEVMPLVSQVARILGPRGLMPNPKMGTVTRNVAEAVKVQFKADRFGMVHAPVGKVNFTNEQLLENIRAFMIAISNAKPEGAKAKYLQAVHINTTMGKACRVEVATVDPRSPRFMHVEGSPSGSPLDPQQRSPAIATDAAGEQAEATAAEAVVMAA